MTVSEKRKPPAAGMGRPKGAVNKTTKAVKEALVEAFDRLGGVESLVEWARRDQSEFYKLWVKVMPQQTEITGADGGPIQSETRIDPSLLSVEQLRALASIKIGE